MTGSLENDLMAFFEKSFLYGSLLFLLIETGVRLRTASNRIGFAAICDELGQKISAGQVSRDHRCPDGAVDRFRFLAPQWIA